LPSPASDYCAYVFSQYGELIIEALAQGATPDEGKKTE
jgi:hypothetical protein